MIIRQTENEVFIGTKYIYAWNEKVKELRHNGYDLISRVTDQETGYISGVFRKREIVDSEGPISTPSR